LLNLSLDVPECRRQLEPCDTAIVARNDNQAIDALISPLFAFNRVFKHVAWPAHSGIHLPTGGPAIYPSPFLFNKVI
jgi:hypothetical protein